MDDDQMLRYEKLTEKIFSKPPEERERFLKEIREKDLKYYERIEHLIRFLTSREENLETYAHKQIRRILEDLEEE